jgi:hypothetical protein
MTAMRLTIARPVLVGVVRGANAVFSLVTATYCLLTYSSFAYQQFIRPHLVSSLASFVVWHHIWHWVLLGATAITLVPELKSARGRLIAWSYLATMTGMGLVLLTRPVLPNVENNAVGLVLAFVFLVPPIWLAAFDHAATSPAFRPSPSRDRHLLVGALTTAVVVWTIHVLAVPLRIDEVGELRLTGGGIAFGVATSGLMHLVVFALFGLVAVGCTRLARLTREPGTSEYWLWAMVAAAGTMLTAVHLVFARLSFRGAAAWFLAAAAAIALTAVWSGIARRLAVDRGEAGGSAVDAWLAPIPGTRSRTHAMTGLAALAGAAFVVIERVSTFDWDFLVQNLAVMAMWVLTFAFVHALIRVRSARIRWAPIAFTAAMLIAFIAVRGPVGSRLLVALTRPAFVPEFVLDGYAAADPSYRLIRHVLSVDVSGSAEFYAYLRANTSIEHQDIAPIDIDFVRPLPRAAGPPPNIFLLIIDSLRRDYVSAYNPAVTFTPSLGRFAAENYAFDRAFTAYGGTGLSMPAMWAGGLLFHKQYVLPFRRMNALEKLLRSNEYRMLMSMDHITAQLVEPSDDLRELDQGRNEMEYDFCGTLAEIQTMLRPGAGADAPVFVHTRSLNLHVSKLRNRSVAPDPAYGGFQATAAAAIRRMDTCFGRFIAFLQRTGLYDESIVIVTSDHGDSLGESKRWGHAYTLFPEVIRIPLLMHVPSRLRDRVTDLGAVAMSTDITPTLYGLLGYHPARLGWPYGAPLFEPPGADVSWRRAETFLLASSYGPVYGVLRNNGRSLYIADALNQRDYAYDLASLRPVRVGVTQKQRAVSRDFIRQRLHTLADMYHFNPPL